MELCPALLNCVLPFEVGLSCFKIFTTRVRPSLSSAFKESIFKKYQTKESSNNNEVKLPVSSADVFHLMIMITMMMMVMMTMWMMAVVVVIVLMPYI